MKRPEILKLLQEQFPAKPAEALTDGATLGNDLGGDSLDQIELVMALEEAGRFEVSDDELALFFGPASTIGALVGFVEGRTGEA